MPSRSSPLRLVRQESDPLRGVSKLDGRRETANRSDPGSSLQKLVTQEVALPDSEMVMASTKSLNRRSPPTSRIRLTSSLSLPKPPIVLIV